MAKDFDQGANAEYWAEQARNAIPEISTKEVDGVTAIAGDAVIELGDGWDQSTARALRDGLREQDFPPMSLRGTDQIRIAANSDRLLVPFVEGTKARFTLEWEKPFFPPDAKGKWIVTEDGAPIREFGLKKDARAFLKKHTNNFGNAGDAVAILTKDGSFQKTYVIEG